MEIKASGSGNLVFKISTKAMDRDEDVMEPMGCDLTNYRANPVVLFAHDYQSPPIGKSIRESIYPEFIESEVEFAPTAFAQDCKKLCEGGFLNAASVGFNGIESEPVQGSKWGKHYKKWELLEWSVVPVPANAGSLIQGAKAKGLNLDAMEKELNIETKTADIFGNPSTYDIERAIQNAINPGYNLPSVWVSELYPINFPSGNVIICRQDKYFQHSYTYTMMNDTPQITLSEGTEVVTGY
ncbi:MAG: HK97 family phage prohead protease, partial [Eubacteriales bacterium]